MNNQEQTIVAPLGQALKDARLTASLSIEEVAEQLNLGVFTVRELEDSLDELLQSNKYPVIYLRGYLANYGKLVGLDKLNQFIEYQQLSVPACKKETADRRPVMIQAGKSKKSKPWFSILFIILVIVAAAYFMLQRYSQSTHVKNNDLQQIEMKTEKTAAPVLEKEDEQLLTAEPAVASENEKQLDVVEAVVKEKPAPETLQLTEKAEVVNEEPVVIKSLTLSFSADCWTEITDAAGKRVAFDLYKEGHVLKVNGVAPFKLMLGDPSVVEIQYQDTIIKREFVAGRSARFSVPEK